MSKIAIIGTGISGLAAAYILYKQHDITVYEKAGEIGGHTRTRVIDYNGASMAVDTGFIVFNHRNYPELTGLFRHLGVPTQKSVMSFGVSANHGTLEWSAESPNSLFGQRSNLLNVKFYKFLLDIVRFNARARKKVVQLPGLTLGELIAHMGLGDWFARYYILPMGGAIWSCPLSAILEFPAKSFVDFFDAHGLLTVTQQPQWHTVTGGSHVYLQLLSQPFADRVRTASAAQRVTRTNGKVQVADARGETHEYDQVIFACHANETLALLNDNSREEHDILSAFTYQSNLAVLHKDTSIMPQRRRCWASWVYHADDNAPQENLSVTYWMNQLQSLDATRPVFVTLNPLKPIAPEHVFDTHTFEHPVYTTASVAAQKLLPGLQGKNNSWFCGAYHRNGFHEDGLVSALSVAKALGGEAPWH